MVDGRTLDLANVRFEDTSFLKQKLTGIDPITVKVDESGAWIESKSYNDQQDFKVVFAHETAQRDKEAAVNMALTMMIHQLNADLEPGEPINTKDITISGTREFQKIAKQELEKIEFAIERGEFLMPNGSEPYRPESTSKENVIGVAQEPVKLPLQCSIK